MTVTLDPALVAARLGRHGFAPAIVDGCPAYIRTDGEIDEVIALRDVLPGGDSNCDVWSTDGRDDGPIIPGTIRITLSNVLAALDDPRDEYALLDLRIEQHYGNAWPGHVYGSTPFDPTLAAVRLLLDRVQPGSHVTPADRVLLDAAAYLSKDWSA